MFPENRKQYVDLQKLFPNHMKCYENSLKFPKPYNLFIIQCILSIHSLALPPVQLRRGLRRRRAGDGQREGVDELRQVPAEARVLVRVGQGLEVLKRSK